MTTVEALIKDIEQIKERNESVELDKAWEISFLRKILLIFFTYLAIGFYLQAIEIEKPWLNAIVPALAFYLSTLTLPYIKRIWKKYIYK